LASLTGTTLPVFIGLTLVLLGGAASMMGQAVATTWAPAWHNVLYGLLLGVGDRLLGFLLFGGELLSITGYLIDTAILTAIALVSYRATRAHAMVRQYPWLYERSGLFGWRERTR